MSEFITSIAIIVALSAIFIGIGWVLNRDIVIKQEENKRKSALRSFHAARNERQFRKAFNKGVKKGHA